MKENENLPYGSLPVILGCIETLVCPLSILGTYICEMVSTCDGNSPAAGVAFLMLLVIGVVVVPVVIVDFVPFFLFVDAIRKGRRNLKKAAIMLIISDLVFIVELVLLDGICCFDNQVLAASIIICFIYVIASVVTMGMLGKQQEAIEELEKDKIKYEQ